MRCALSACAQQSSMISNARTLRVAADELFLRNRTRASVSAAFLFRYSSFISPVFLPRALFVWDARGIWAYVVCIKLVVRYVYLW
jgi:hypothetical protein